jgi:hypothetical protein
MVGQHLWMQLSQNWTYSMRHMKFLCSLQSSHQNWLGHPDILGPVATLVLGLVLAQLALMQG